MELLYEKPAVSYWKAEELNGIRAQMSGGGGGGSLPPIDEGQDKKCQTVRYDGRAKYARKDITQSGAIAYSYANFGKDSANTVYCEIDIATACKARVWKDGHSADANILREAQINVEVSGQGAELHYAEHVKVYSNPKPTGYGSAEADNLSKLTSLLSLCAGQLSDALGAVLSITSFIAGKLADNKKDQQYWESFSYGQSELSEFAQAVRLELAIPEGRRALVTISYCAPGESTDTDFIHISDSFYVYGRYKG